MIIGKIYYLIPDIKPLPINFMEDIISDPKRVLRRVRGKFVRKRNRIIGGIKVHYQHCTVLNNLGYRAYPVLMGRQNLHSFGYPGKVLSIAELGTNLNSNDIVVSTEFFPYEGLLFKNALKVIFVQNWINLEPNRRLKPEDDTRDYIQIGYDHVISCSKFVQQYVWNKMNIWSSLIPNGIDLTKFKPKAEVRENNRILYMPRKNRRDIERIKKSVEHIPVEFIAADGLSEEQLIMEYQKSDIFLASGYPEGFGLPPLEAMACGCAVVGFTGRGASEYMIDRKTAMVARDGDCETAARKLRELIENTVLKDAIRERGQIMARGYSIERTRECIADFYRSLGAECGWSYNDIL